MIALALRTKVFRETESSGVITLSLIGCMISGVIMASVRIVFVLAKHVLIGTLYSEHISEKIHKFKIKVNHPLSYNLYKISQKRSRANIKSK